ncbi:MerR family transcriptional regulator [Catenuloplanes japonicus]|uniref:MerR family transcriptional regulator n=1 Tax=Catenuloplanes japonicus TaxID=33876 RepID=UPI0005250895|nr:MerR family transcriptional regulator [Catenuloplanes japonicus]
MRIGDLSARTGVSTRSLRYYEEQGLLTSARSGGGHRHYTEDEVERVRYIQRLFAAGLSSQTIAALLPCVESPSLGNSEAAFAVLIAERGRLAAHIDDLVRTLAALDEVIVYNRTARLPDDQDQGQAGVRQTS